MSSIWKEVGLHGASMGERAQWWSQQLLEDLDPGSSPWLRQGKHEVLDPRFVPVLLDLDEVLDATQMSIALLGSKHPQWAVFESDRETIWNELRDQIMHASDRQLVQYANDYYANAPSGR